MKCYTPDILKWIFTIYIRAQLVATQVYKSQSTSFSDYYQPNRPNMDRMDFRSKPAEEKGTLRNRHQQLAAIGVPSTNDGTSLPVLQRFHCFSCMSEEVQPFWTQLQHRFQSPASFTADCNYISDRATQNRLNSVPCAGICLSMKWKWKMAGVTMATIVYRGCSQSMLRDGFVNSTLAELDRIDACYSLPDYMVYTKGVMQPIRGTVAATVQIGALRGVEPDTRTEQIFAGHEVIQICSCLGDRCVPSSGESVWTTRFSGKRKLQNGAFMALILFVFIVI